MNDTLLAIGEVLIDFIPNQTGCSFSEVSAFSPCLGGAPANVCGAFSRLGGQAKLLSQVGDDPFGHKILDELSACGVDISAVPLTKKANTALAFVSLDANGDRTFSFYRNPSADMLFTPEQIQESWFLQAYALHFCSVSLGNTPMCQAHRCAVDFARKHDVIVSFDPNIRLSLWEHPAELQAAVREFLPYADILKLSDEELAFVTGTDDIERALPQLWKHGIRLVIYTCGSGGAYAYTPHISVFSPAAKVSAVDTTGAGDGFIGAFLWKLQQHAIGLSELSSVTDVVLQDCMDFSNAFCAVSVQAHGAISSYPTLDAMQNK